MRFGASLAFLVALSWPAMGAAQIGQWQLMGQHAVRAGDDRQEIPVNRAAGRISRIQLRVADNDVEIHRIILTFSDGRRETINIGRTFPAGGRTPGIDIPGSSRHLQRAEVVYTVASDASGGPPTVQLWGLLAGPLITGPGRPLVLPPRDLRRVPTQPAPSVFPPDAGPASGWRALGEVQIDLESERAELSLDDSVGDLERLKVLSADVEVHVVSVTVSFAEGDPQVLPLDQLIRASGQSPAFEIESDRGPIRRVELRYRAPEGTSGRARVVILGSSTR